MKKYVRFLPFAISIICLTVYVFYIIYIKLNPSVIVTDAMITTLKVILIIALVSLFIGLLMILIRKIYDLRDQEEVVVRERVVTTTTKPETIVDKKIVSVTKPEVKVEKKMVSVKKPEVVVKENEGVIINNKVKEEVVKETKKEVISEVKKEEIIVKEESENSKLLLVSCPECNGLISENAAICPHCGIIFDKEVIKVIKKYDREKEDSKKSYGIVSTLINLCIIVLFVIFIIILINVLVDKYNKNYKHLNIFNTEEKDK